MNKGGSRLVNFLLVAGVTIAAPRLVGAFGQLIGVDVLASWPWFAGLEVFTGFPLAILEGLALAHIANKWKKFPHNSPYWWILLLIQITLLTTLPFVSTAYLIASQYDEPARNILTWSHILTNHLTWLWSYLGAAISTIIVMGIGIVHNIDNEEDVKPNDQKAAVLSALANHGKLDPGTLAEIANVPHEVAVREIDNLIRVFGPNGSK